MEKMIDKLVKAYGDAYRIALEKEIKVNTIVLNKKYDFCNKFYIATGRNSINGFPPTIFGKAVILADLPDDYAFALTETNIQTVEEYIHSLERENAALHEKLNKLKDLIDE